MIARAISWIVLAIPALASAAAVEDLRIEHVTVISPERTQPLVDATVSIHDGRIVAITTGKHPGRSQATATVDGSGLFLTPGLIDSHVHLGDVPGMTTEQEAIYPDIAKAARNQVPRSFLLHGFTTLVDLISTPEAMARWKAHDLVPDTYFCGGAALVDGYPMNWTPKPARYQGAPYMLIEAGTPAPEGIDPTQHTPAAVVSRMKADGAICVKTFFERGFAPGQNLPVPKIATVRELVRVAHSVGLPVFIHANSAEAQSFAVDAGVDVIAHGMWNWSETSPTTQITPAIQATLDRGLAQKIGWQPTIQVLHGERDLFLTGFLADPELQQVLPRNLLDWYGTAAGQWFRNTLAEGYPGLKGKDPKAAEAIVVEGYQTPLDRVQHATTYLAAHEARFLFGTDTPSAPTYANPPGLNGWWEMQRLVAAGLSPSQVFQAATLVNARALKLDHDVGIVAVGKRANLLMLRADPTQTIDAYHDIVKVILGGRVLDPASLAAH